MTPDPELAVATAARLCYADAHIGDLRKKVEKADQSRFIADLLSAGHQSTFEHASFTFGVEGVSRSLLAQITRHRIASFSVQSQRYVAAGKKGAFTYVLPPAIQALGPEATARFEAQMAQAQAWYDEWRAALGGGEQGNEDARFVLPNAAETRFLVTMNARELRHFFSLRCCSRAQWEIRALAKAMRELCLAAAPALFAACGPACLRGPCPEGKRTCGRAAQVRAEFAAPPAPPLP